MDDSLKCEICQSSGSKYHCPKCKISFCSVSCYQSEKHLQCSEFFYHTLVQEELKNSRADPELSKKFLEILKQQQNQDLSDESLDSDDEEGVLDLASRMVEVNLDDDEAVWEKLTSDEKKEFKNLISTGNIIKILPEWEPWWEIKMKKRLVQEVKEIDFDWKSVCPAVPGDIPPLADLTKSKPSPHVVFMVLNVLSSYVFTVRWFKGAHLEMPVEATSTVAALSETLSNSKIFTNSTEAFLSFEDNLFKCKWIKSDDYNKDIVYKDLHSIINDSTLDDSYCIKAALSDLNNLFDRAITTVSQEKNAHLRRFSGPPLKINRIHLISKKLAYYLSWTSDHGHLLQNVL